MRAAGDAQALGRLLFGDALPERLTLEHGGQRYQRQSGAWLDRGLIVARELSLQLDAKAKADPDFWEKCTDQDFDDDPKNRGKWREHLSKEESAELFPSATWDSQHSVPASPQPVPGYQSSSPRRRKRDSDHLKCDFKGDREVMLRCDIDGGWRPTQRAWYFNASAPIQLRWDHVLRATATIREDTSGQWNRRNSDVGTWREPSDETANLDGTPPQFSHLDNIRGPIGYVLEGASCTFVLQLFDNARELNKDLPWNYDGKRWNFRFVDYGVYEIPIRSHGLSVSQSRAFKMDLHCVLRPPPRAKLQPEYEYDTPMPSAGLPSLGKRR